MYSKPDINLITKILFFKTPSFAKKGNDGALPSVKNKLQKLLAGLLIRFLCLLFVLLLGISSSEAQQETDYAIHANIMYHFTKYIDWPSSMKSGDFVIGVVGGSPLYDELKKNIANKLAGEQKIVVKKVSVSSVSFNCHILFIGEDETGSLKKVAARTTGMPILLVTESEGLAKKGACINFGIVSDRLVLEINKENIEQRNLSIASELIRLGKIVK